MRAGREPSNPASRSRLLRPQTKLSVPAEETLRDLQRTAGNRAVTGLVTARFAVQRHPGTEPEIAAAHIVSASETADVPAAADLPALATEKAALLTERTPLADRVKAAKKAKTIADPADTARIKEIDDRLVEIKRRQGLRVKADEAITLEHNGFTAGTDAWFRDVHTVPFLGRNATVHRYLADRLVLVENALKDLPVPPDGWVSETHSSLREPGQSLHSFGLAIDLNPGTNPFLVQPTNPAIYEPANWSQSIEDVFGRAALLILKRIDAKGSFFARPDIKDKNERVGASYDKIAEMSGALQRYLALADAHPTESVGDLVTALGATDPKHRSAQDWLKTIKADRRTIDDLAGSKSWNKPERGFLNLDKRLVKAMTDPAAGGLTWLGDDTVSPGRDIMHFDMRGVAPNPITKIWSTAANKDTYLGNG
jgi:hypothetical protein